MKLIILITADSQRGLEVALRWQEAGAPGVTLLRSFGLYSLQSKISSDSLEVPMHIGRSMISLMTYALREMEHTNHVLLSVVPKEMIPTLLDEARAVMGDLTEPNHGVAFVVPLDEAIGVQSYGLSSGDG